jgi:hypothetical protein
MKNEVDWWELDDNEILLLNDQTIDFLLSEIKRKYRSLNWFRRKLNIGMEIYHSLKYKNQGISVSHLKKILKELKLTFDIINENVVGIGKYKSLKNTKFPIKISPYWGELLAHSFFDGYADKFVMRYSNYDANNRKEFVLLVKRIFGNNIAINKPDNYERNIDLPPTVPRLLSKFFGIKVFYSKRCRISKKFFDLVKEDNRIGYYFLKGAFIDEGSITGGQIFIVRGIKNRKLAKDVEKLSKLLELNTGIKKSNKKLFGYSVVLYRDSWESFYEIIKTITWNHNHKIIHMNKMLILSQIPRNRNIYGKFIKTEIGRIFNG